MCIHVVQWNGTKAKQSKEMATYFSSKVYLFLFVVEN